MSSSISPVPQMPRERPLAPARDSQPESVDLIAQSRAMAAGESRLLPTLAHVRALIAHVDQLIEGIEIRDGMIQDVLGDWLRERNAKLALAQKLGEQV